MSGPTESDMKVLFFIIHTIGLCKKDHFKALTSNVFL